MRVASSILYASLIHASDLMVPNSPSSSDIIIILEDVGRFDWVNDQHDSFQLHLTVVSAP